MDSSATGWIPVSAQMFLFLLIAGNLQQWLSFLWAYHCEPRNKLLLPKCACEIRWTEWWYLWKLQALSSWSKLGFSHMSCIAFFLFCSWWLLVSSSMPISCEEDFIRVLLDVPSYPFSLVKSPCLMQQHPPWQWLGFYLCWPASHAALFATDWSHLARAPSWWQLQITRVLAALGGPPPPSPWLGPLRLGPQLWLVGMWRRVLWARFLQLLIIRILQSGRGGKAGSGSAGRRASQLWWSGGKCPVGLHSRAKRHWKFMRKCADQRTLGPICHCRMRWR